MPDEKSKNETQSLPAIAIGGVVAIATTGMSTIGAIVWYTHGGAGGDKSKEKN